MERLRPMLSVAMLLVVALTGCGILGSGQNAAPTLIATGESLDMVKGQFVTIGGVMNNLLDAKAISPDGYAPWRTFAIKFKGVYPIAVQSWLAAKKVCSPPPPAVIDAASCTAQSEAVKAQAAALAGELAGLAAQAYLLVAAAPTSQPGGVRVK